MLKPLFTAAFVLIAAGGLAATAHAHDTNKDGFVSKHDLIAKDDN